MPTPVAPIIDAASSISDAFVAAGWLFDSNSLYVALAIGISLTATFIVFAKRSVRR